MRIKQSKKLRSKHFYNGKSKVETSITRVVLQDDLSNNPHCIHGPCILWKTSSMSSPFYGCSSYRSRKECPFFEKFAPNKQIHLVEHETHPHLPFVLERQSRLKALETRGEISYCSTCHLCWQNQGELKTSHQHHHVHKGLSLSQMKHPLSILEPLSANKGEAQFHFTKLTMNVIMSWFKKNKWKNVLCLGAPSVFEALKHENLGARALLLDIDDRLASFYDMNEEWLWFNMFNNHFFLGNESERTFQEFLRSASSDLVIVTDPPFGGKCELIARTLNAITQYWRLYHGILRVPQIFWIFPYFMEHQIISCMDNLYMADFQVDYTNHKTFQNGTGGRKSGSPVRVFTNVDGICLPFPENLGYQFCAPCEKWVSPNNRHCDICGSCTAKNGETYKHCRKCKRCVKKKFSHCKLCNRCALPDHPCNLFRDKSIADPKRQ
ncbi:hypothetical protein TCAL_01749 [Tigriopus californicus]|uniref:CTCHY-type domain-containing protein n=1 Tax=Tigriopus californicus TaxID=6832 RepID=A0A553PM76_TIGCA|nr:rRNA N6-adenosine-methyltransferase ZCCHC4-like isoform X1 [Tigriopus californicus]TRY78780.1 hypothetical protein TCAL_01749 [Tigriopus californicus]